MHVLIAREGRERREVRGHVWPWISRVRLTIAHSNLVISIVREEGERLPHCEQDRGEEET
jgi:hypothetical protein